ncbi:MAG: RNA-guided endonuclease TnpB family protein [Caldisphaeraceae archaeon]|nr:RNA-guided endonuclease TnpB family protein [Caldisphaeraceae archaeon]
MNQQLHTIAKEIVAYAKQFEKPIIVMEKLDGIRDSMNGSAKLNRRLHAWSFRKLQMYVKYKANLEGIPVVYVNPKNTSKRCHRCGHVAQANGREFRCPKCGLVYNRDLNAAINIAHTLMRGMGWGSCEPPELPNEVLVKNQHGTGETPPLRMGQFTLLRKINITWYYFALFPLLYHNIKFACHNYTDLMTFYSCYWSEPSPYIKIQLYYCIILF